MADGEKPDQLLLLGKKRAVMCARAVEEEHDGYGDVVF